MSDHILNKIIIEDNQKRIIWNYSKKYINSYYSKDRPDIKKLSDIYIGKLSELAFKLLYKNYVSNLYLDNKIDPGYDFIIKESNKTVDIKCLKRKHYHKLYINNLKSDYIVGMKTDSFSIVENYNDVSDEFFYIGYLDKFNTNKYLESSNDFNYLDIKYLIKDNNIIYNNL